MTWRALAAAWLTAIALAGLFVLAVLLLPAEKPLPFAPGTSAVFIGSSLTRHAVPFDPLPQGILGDGRPHTRWSVANIDEALTAELMARAIDSEAGIIAVELNSLTTDTRAEAARQSQGLAGKMNEWLTAFSKRLRYGYSTLKGEPRSAIQAGDPDLTPTAWRVTDRLREVVMPYAFHAPRAEDRLRALVASARAHGKTVLFFEPPRPEATIAAMGPERTAAFTANLRKAAEDLQSPLILFGPAWPDELFRDPVHLNSKGRQRFLAELPGRVRAVLP